MPCRHKQPGLFNAENAEGAEVIIHRDWDEAGMPLGALRRRANADPSYRHVHRPATWPLASIATVAFTVPRFQVRSVNGRASP